MSDSCPCANYSDANEFLRSWLLDVLECKRCEIPLNINECEGLSVCYLGVMMTTTDLFVWQLLWVRSVTVRRMLSYCFFEWDELPVKWQDDWKRLTEWIAVAVAAAASDDDCGDKKHVNVSEGKRLRRERNENNNNNGENFRAAPPTGRRGSHQVFAIRDQVYANYDAFFAFYSPDLRECRLLCCYWSSSYCFLTDNNNDNGIDRVAAGLMAHQFGLLLLPLLLFLLLLIFWNQGIKVIWYTRHESQSCSIIT